MTCTDIFKEIAKRQITALMFHDQMRDLYDFLGLSGFKRWHQHHYIAESKEFHKLKHYFMSTHNKLLDAEGTKEPISVIPDDWYNYTRMDVTPQLRKQHVEASFEAYKTWEEETKKCYEEYSKALYDMGNVADALKVDCLVKDVTCELKHLYKWMLKLKAVNYDMNFILEIQPCFHKKYK
jgi:hypothetical protein